MKAAILENLNKPLKIAEIELTELEVGQVLVKNIISGLCGAQLHEINGNKGNEKFLPHLMCHEGCGIIEAIGPGVSTVKKGDKVVTSGGITGTITRVVDNDKVEVEISENVTVEVIRGTGIQSLMNSQEIKK